MSSKFQQMRNATTHSIQYAKFKTSSLWTQLVNLISRNTMWFVLFEIFIFFLLWLAVYTWNPGHISNYYPAQTKIGFLIVIFIMMSAAFYVQWKYQHEPLPPPNQRNKDKKHPIIRFIFRTGLILLGLLALICWVYAVVKGISWLLHSNPNPKIINMLGNGFFLISLFFGLAVLYLVFKPIAKKGLTNNKFFKLLEDFVFYIPCLIINIVDYLKKQWEITTPTVLIILAFEVVFITIYFVIPYLYKFINVSGGKQMLKDPIYIDYATTLGPFQNISVEDIQNLKAKKFDYNFSLSAWFRLNPQEPGIRPSYSKWTNILSFGNKPRIEFNALYNKFRVRTGLNNGEQVLIYTTQSLPFQKWNNIVVNYYGGTMDIFLNGELVSSRPNVVPCLSYDTVVAGEHNGLEGGICNVTYHKTPLSKRNIEFLYKLLSTKQTPVF